jgi:DNA replication protein DnaC
MNKELIEHLKYLRLGGLLAHWDEYLKLAAEQNFSHTRLLTHVLEEECRIKRENARRLRLKRACVPEPLVIETFPFERQPKLNQKKMMALYDSLDYMQNHQNIIWLGVTGCGKTGWPPASSSTPLSRATAAVTSSLPNSSPNFTAPSATIPKPKSSKNI